MTFYPPAHFSLLQPTALAPGSSISHFDETRPPWSARNPHRGMDIPNRYMAPGYIPCDGLSLGPDRFYNGGDFGPYALCIRWYDWLAGKLTDVYVLIAHNALLLPNAMPGKFVRTGELGFAVGNLGKTDGGSHVHIQVSNTPTFPADISTCADPAQFMVRGNPMDIMQQIADLNFRVRRAERLICGNGYARLPGIPRENPASIALTGDDALAAADANGSSLFLGLGDTQADLAALRSKVDGKD